MSESQTQPTNISRPDWLGHDVWPFDIRSIEVDGKLVAYTDEGEGPTILLVHDGMWSYIWGQLITELKGDHRVVTLDFPGSGLSPDSDEPASLAGDSHLLEAFVDQLDLESMTLAVHDLGGSVGLALAVRRPELFDGLVLLNTFAWPPHVASLERMFKIITSRPVEALNVATNLVPRLTSGSFGIGANLDSEQRRAFLGGFADHGPRRRFHDLMGAAQDERDFLAQTEAGLGTILRDKPTLTIYGEKNDPFGFQEKFRSYFHDIDEMVIPKGNHFPMADDPSGIAARIRTWQNEWSTRAA
jgi:haloalkane dehalogenase